MSLNSRILRSLVLLASLVAMAGCDQGKGGKVPLTTSSDKARGHFLKGIDLADRLRQQEAVLEFQAAVNEDSQFALAYLTLALASSSGKGFFDNLERAKSLADRASEGERLMILAAEAGSSGDPVRQRHLLAKLVEEYPEDERAFDLLGNYFFGQQEYDSALTVYIKATELAPQFSPPYNQMGYCYRFQGKFAEAEQAFRKYMELIPDDPNPYDSYADLLCRMGRYQESIESFEKALSVSPTFTGSYIGIAANLNFLDRHAEARDVLRGFLNRSIDDGQRRAALLGIAVSYTDQGLLDSALGQLGQMYALAEAADDATAMGSDLINMGFLLRYTDRPGAAAESYDQALKIIDASNLSKRIKENVYLDGIQRSALVALAQGDTAAARARAEDYLSRVEPLQNPFRLRAGHMALGLTALARSDYATAITELQQADQQQAFVLFKLANTYEGSGNTEEAARLYDSVAGFNQFNSLSYALVRKPAIAKAAALNPR